MGTKIFYFSGTGNSLQVAKDIANDLKDASLISIPKVIDENIHIAEDKVGFVFPVYAFGVPRIVNKFIKKLNITNNKYVFAVATCAGTQGGALEQVSMILREKGINLSSGFVINQPSNYIIMGEAPSEDKQNKMFNDSKIKAKEIALIIKERKQIKLEKNIFLINYMGIGINKLFSKNGSSMDKKFYIDEKCVNCGICEKICPVENITMINDKRGWLGNCEQCMACIQWCPKEAIQYTDKTQNKKRYHNPNIKVEELL